MSKHLLTIFVALVIGLSLLFYLVTYQVRSNEVAMVLRFGKPVKPLPKAGIHLRWPWPIDEVRYFDNRLHVEEGYFEERYTRDRYNVIVSVCVGWRIAEDEDGVDQFNKNFGGGLDPIGDGWTKLRDIVRDRVHVAIGNHDLTDFVSVREDMRAYGHPGYDKLESEIAETSRGEAASTYGIDVVLLKIKRLELPQSVTAKVYDRMKADRERESNRIITEGQTAADVIRENARSQSEQIVARAEAEAKRIRGEGDAEAAKHYEVLKANPDLAIYLRKIQALREVTKDGTTVVVDTTTPPFDLFTSGTPKIEDRE